MANAEAERLAKAWISHFWASNHQIQWQEIETEKLLWLSPNTVLVGKEDAIGKTEDGPVFFADWKTASKSKARFMESEKMRWRMTPQALTYGVLNASVTTHFTIRWALKTEPASCDFEWYSYTTDELDWWRVQLVHIAEDIREQRRKQYVTYNHWETNLTNCARYGEKYKCPFRDEGCYARNFSFIPDSMTPRTQSHLTIENELRASGKVSNDVVVLDASRVGDWLHCHEFYRRLWEGEGLSEENEALEIGDEFHRIIAAHLKQIQREQQAK